MHSLFLAMLAAAIGGAYAFPGNSKASSKLSKQVNVRQARRRLGGDHGPGEKPICGCEAIEEDHPFNMNCEDKAAVNAAEMYLREHCPLGNMSNSWYEWAGVFDVPGDLYRWSAQPTGNPLEYADPEMETMFIPIIHVDEARRRLEHPGHEDFWPSLIPEAVWWGNCTEVISGQTIVPMAHKCYKMIFNNPAIDSEFEIDTTGINEMAVFTGHVPTEFERDRHYLYSPTNDDIEPKDPPGELSQQSTCGVESEDGIKRCQQAFFTIQAHHDYCPPGTIAKNQSELMHEYENYCISCAVDRQFIEGAPICVKPQDCASDGAAFAALHYLNNTCEIDGPEGSCCRDADEIAEYDILYSFHEFCGTDMAEELEVGMHHFEIACEKFICSTVTEEFDPMFCPPPEMTWEEKARAAGWAPCKDKPGSGKMSTSRRLSAARRALSTLSVMANEDD